MPVILPDNVQFVVGAQRYCGIYLIGCTARQPDAGTESISPCTELGDINVPAAGRSGVPYCPYIAAAVSCSGGSGFIYAPDGRIDPYILAERAHLGHEGIGSFCHNISKEVCGIHGDSLTLIEVKAMARLVGVGVIGFGAGSAAIPGCAAVVRAIAGVNSIAVELDSYGTGIDANTGIDDV